MPGCDHPVHLSGSAPFEIGCGQIFFYDVIESDAMSRSSVLSCVAEGGGEAKLPQSVTVSEFRKWLTAVTDSDVVYRNRSFASMCTIVKVAPASPCSSPSRQLCTAADHQWRVPIFVRIGVQ